MFKKLMDRWIPIILLVFVLSCLGIYVANSATSNPSPASPGYDMVTLHFDSQLTADVTDKAEFTMPFPSQLVKIQCVARALGGSASPTYTFTLQEAAGALATCAPTAAGTVVEGTITDSAVADEANITLDYDSEGTSPTADDVTVLLIFKRL
jgi:hypothetical protein